MAKKEKRHLLRVHVKHQEKGKKPLHLPQGCVCPPELVDALKKQGLLVLEGDEPEEVDLNEGVSVGEPGIVDGDRDLPPEGSGIDSDEAEAEDKAESDKAVKSGKAVNPKAKKGK